MRTPIVIQTCRKCGKKTTKGILIREGEYRCYGCYVDSINFERKAKKGSEEANIQIEFFSKVKLFFPTLPDLLLFHVGNGGVSQGKRSFQSQTPGR
jgi:hypothetical protein